MIRRSPALASFLLGVAVVTLAFLAFGQAAPDTAAPVRVGRYQMLGNRGGVFIIDTATGQLWGRNERTVESFGTPDLPEYRSFQAPDR